MRVALVHDYLNEFGGAERVLEALCEIWPKAPIYTAFYRKGSAAYGRFKDKNVRVSWAQIIPFFSTRLHSPLRFLAPLIWRSFVRQLADYDVVITSASWYVTKGLRKAKDERQKAIEICYCHTPPRYLYGYQTAVEWQKFWPVKFYALIVNHFMRVYDFEAAQRVDYFIANSEETAARIKKFYRREAKVIYPPVDLPRSSLIVNGSSGKKTMNDRQSPAVLVESDSTAGLKRSTKNGYFLVVSRIVGGKGLQLAVEAANKLGFRLKVVGKPAGYGGEFKKLASVAGSTVEFLGFVTDEELVDLYSGARAFLALATDEDFGITPLEAMLCGTPVIAYGGGGYLESVVEGKTGVFFKPATAGSLALAVNKFNQLEKEGAFDRALIRKHAQKFSKERFKREILKFVESKIK